MTTQKKPQKKPPIFANKQWQQCVDDFLNSLYVRRGSTDTPKQWDNILRRFFSDPKRTPETYTRQEVEAFLSRLTTGKRGTGKAPMPGTRNNRLTVLHCFYTYASHYTVPFRGKPRPLFRGMDPTYGISTAAVGQKDRSMTDDEVRAFFSVIPRTTLRGLRDAALFSTLLWTGRRRSELVRLRLSDIEPDHIFEDGHRGVLYHWYGKGHARQRDSAELLQPAWEALQQYLAASECTDPNDPIFVRCDGQPQTEPIDPATVDRLFKEYIKLAGLDGRGYTPHSLRHTIARAHYQEERDILEVQTFLRHRDLNTTAIYVKQWNHKADRVGSKLYGKFGQL